MPRLTEHELWQALGDIKTGWYTTREIHDLCTTWINKTGRDPVHINQTARTLKESVLEVRRDEGRPVLWHIYEPWTLSEF